jgi:hypothetical protein
VRLDSKKKRETKVGAHFVVQTCMLLSTKAPVQFVMHCSEFRNLSSDLWAVLYFDYYACKLLKIPSTQLHIVHKVSLTTG